MGDKPRTYPPSKVVHFRNLPFETTDEELRELCEVFGAVVKSKLNVGQNKNQAFVEFSHINDAIKLVAHYEVEANKPKVRGKKVYLQFSTRQEVVNATDGEPEGPSNVILVTLEHMSPDVIITIDILKAVFGKHGVVQKIATFEKSAGFQALIQYESKEGAEKAMEALDGRHVPRDQINNSPNPPMLKISYSQHHDLTVKFQSHRSRDSTEKNKNIPWAPSAHDPGLAHLGAQGPPGSNFQEGNILLTTVENMKYPMTVHIVHTVFSPYGPIQKISIFVKNDQTQALVQYPDGASAANAKQALQGHAIYAGGFNRLKVSFSMHRDLNIKENNDNKGWDYTGGATLPPPILSASKPSAAALAQVPAHHLDYGNVVVRGIDYEEAHLAVSKAANAAMVGKEPVLNPPPQLNVPPPASGPRPMVGATAREHPQGFIYSQYLPRVAPTRMGPGPWGAPFLPDFYYGGTSMYRY